MDTAQTRATDAILRERAFDEGNDIYQTCFNHPAIGELRWFNRNFSCRPLTHSELRLFFASMAAFNRHTIGGIAILAGRLSDQILPLLPKKGHEIGAFVLDAAVDEYGLRETVTHVELARTFSEYLGISTEDIDAQDDACPAAIELGDALFSWYREKPVAFSLGVHTASEITSVEEFISWHDIFLKFSDYRLSRDQPEFAYMRAHFVHEPDHIDKARLCVARYLRVLPEQSSLLREGAYMYLNLYQRMFRQLDSRIFGSRQHFSNLCSD
jgi:hypothetical protein